MHEQKLATRKRAFNDQAQGHKFSLSEDGISDQTTTGRVRMFSKVCCSLLTVRSIDTSILYHVHSWMKNELPTKQERQK